LFIEVATGISAALSSAFTPVSAPCSWVAAFCSSFFLLLGGIDDFEDE
jgi:hypothetical protein